MPLLPLKKTKIYTFDISKIYKE